MFKHDLGDGADLRFLEMRHAPEFLEFVLANTDHLGVWLEWGRSIQTLELAQNFIKRGITRYAEDGLPWVGLWLEDRLVGGILFFPLDARARSTMIGYWLGDNVGGRGLMSKAVLAMLGFVFDELGLNRLELQAHVDNQKSRALATRLGFAFEGVLREVWTLHGTPVDHAAYAMLKSGWTAIKLQSIAKSHHP
jgi:ribosomal-protein-serine acetyltransferase